ncbi:hypothetical protein TNCV_2691781 [Trichonephila clavipes]|uniref:Uncharacterized protein n=1 Tax=Trichonephila clavipes TaxID=2585209 RepID=A0A8X6VYZ0_TRICX|nr:hypothetical protein TNCV_2691781 [Trichonephila clavipes]
MTVEAVGNELHGFEPHLGWIVIPQISTLRLQSDMEAQVSSSSMGPWFKITKSVDIYFRAALEFNAKD